MRRRSLGGARGSSDGDLGGVAVAPRLGDFGVPVLAPEALDARITAGDNDDDDDVAPIEEDEDEDEDIVRGEFSATATRSSMRWRSVVASMLRPWCARAISSWRCVSLSRSHSDFASLRSLALRAGTDTVAGADADADDADATACAAAEDPRFLPPMPPIAFVNASSAVRLSRRIERVFCALCCATFPFSRFAIAFAMAGGMSTSDAAAAAVAAAAAAAAVVDGTCGATAESPGAELEADAAADAVAAAAVDIVDGEDGEEEEATARACEKTLAALKLKVPFSSFERCSLHSTAALAAANACRAARTSIAE